MKSFFLSRVRQLTKAEDGQAMVLTALGLTFIMLMAGLGVDVGYLKYQRHQMQKAADAAALAGASVLTYSSSETNIQNAAYNDSAANGFTNGSDGISVTVYHPPRSGAFINNPAYVEVYVAQPRPTFFMRVGGFNSSNVRARAVASTTGDASGCIYAMDPSSQAALLFNGNINVASTCGIYDNSSDSNNAMRKDGTSGIVQVTGGNGIGVVGGYTGSGYSPTPTTGIARLQDPLQNLAAPTFATPPPPSNCTYTNFTINGSVDPPPLSPGTYCGGITISSSVNVTFQSGTYILYGGGMKVTGSPNLQGTGVMFYNTGRPNGTPLYTYAPITLAGSSTSHLSASLDPNNPYAGILFFQDRNYVSTANADQSTINGTNGAQFIGAMYFLNTTLKYAGTPGVASSTVLVAWQITINGDTQINNDFLNNGGSPLKTAVLAE
jgi:hypothetical protein